jgi:hypothetical protein
MSPLSRLTLRFGWASILASTLWAGGVQNITTPLTWKPTSTLSEFAEQINLAPFAKVKVALLPLVDQRKDKAYLGENREKAAPRSVGTSDNVAAFITGHVLDLMKEAGLPVTDKVEGANLVLSGDILRYDVIETDTYKGELRLMLEVRSGDKVVWKGLAVGRTSRFGRSYKMENYHEVLSDVIVEAVSRLLSDQVFLQVLAGRAMVVAVPAGS